MTSSQAAIGSPQLTVAAIVRDEEELLPAALESVRDVADEIVIVDTGSVDATRSIAQQFGAKVVDFPWRDDFSAARNAAWPAIAGDWVLWIDAGERLPNGGAGQLREFLESQAQPQAGYYAYLEIPAIRPGAAIERCAKLRLLPRRRGLRFTGRVRESAEESAVALGMQLSMSPVTLQRTAAEHDEARKQAKARRDLRLWELEDKSSRQQPRRQLALAEIQAVLGNQVAAAEHFKTALTGASPGSTELLEAWYGLLTSLPQVDPQTRLATCLKALEAFPYDAQLLCATGHCLQQQGRLDLAARTYETAVQFGQIDPRTWHLAEIGEVAAHCLSVVWQLQADDERSAKALQDALERLPHSVRLRKALIDLEVKRDRVSEALAQVEKLPAGFPHRESLKNAVRGACQAVRRNWAPAIAYLEAAYEAGCREPLCLRWYVGALTALGRLADAERIARAWCDACPESSEASTRLAALQETGPAAAGASKVRIDEPQSLLDPGLLSPKLAANLRSLRLDA